MTPGSPECGDAIDRIMEVMGNAFAPEYGEAWTRRQVSDSLLLGRTSYCLIGADGVLEKRDTPGLLRVIGESLGTPSMATA